MRRRRRPVPLVVPTEPRRLPLGVFGPDVPPRPLTADQVNSLACEGIWVTDAEPWDRPLPDVADLEARALAEDTRRRAALGELLLGIPGRDERRELLTWALRRFVDSPTAPAKPKQYSRPVTDGVHVVITGDPGASESTMHPGPRDECPICNPAPKETP